MVVWDNAGKERGIWNSVRWSLMYHKWEVIVFCLVKLQRFGLQGKNKTGLDDGLKEREEPEVYKVSCLSKYLENQSTHWDRNTREGQFSVIHSSISNQSSSTL